MPKGKDIDDKTVITLAKDDCALVIRPDGTTECYLPHPDDDHDYVGLHALICSAVSIKVQDKNFVEEMIDFMEKEQDVMDSQWVH